MDRPSSSATVNVALPPMRIALVADPSSTAGRLDVAPPAATQRPIVPVVDGRGRVIGRQIQTV